MDVGQTVGGIGGGIAGAALLGALDGPLPFMDIVGGGIGSAIGGDIGKAIGGKGKRMAGQIDPRLLMMTTNTSTPNPNTQGLGLVDPNQGHNLPFAKYSVDPNPQGYQTPLTPFLSDQRNKITGLFGLPTGSLGPGLLG